MQRSVKFVTGNPGKLREVQAILPNFTITAVNDDLEEYQGDPITIAMKKCVAASTNHPGPVLVEDTSLCFDALGGLPGPYIKWFLKELGPDGLPKLLAGFDNKKAEAKCVFAYTADKSNIQVFEGVCKGTIVEPRGERNFGWDPCFQPEGFDKTFAEMDPTEKNKISHRAQALKGLKAFFDQDEHEQCRR